MNESITGKILMDEDYTNEDLDDVESEELKTEAREPANIDEETLISYLVGNYDAWILASPIIKSVYFTKQYRPVIDYVFEHTEEYKQIPSLEILKMKTGISLVIPQDAKDERTLRWVLDNVEMFCRHQAMRIEVINAAEILSRDKSVSAAETICLSMKTVTEIKILRDLGIEMHRDSKRLLTEDDDLIQLSTGYRDLDTLTGGGMPIPGVAVFAGQSGFGKSVSLMNLAVKYAERGANVIYVTLEMSEKRIQRKICSIMTDINIKELRARADTVDDALQERLRCGDGFIFVKKMKTAGTTISDISAYHKEVWIREKIKPTILCLDYMDLMYPRTKGIRLDNIHLKDKYVSEELYDFVSDNDMICFTASQMTKSAGDEEQYKQGNVAGGTGKVNTSDYTIALRRDVENQMMWWHILKARDGGSEGWIPLKWNDDTLRMSDHDIALFHERNKRFDPNFNMKKHVQYKPVNRNARSEQILTDLNTKNTREVIQESGRFDDGDRG